MIKSFHISGFKIFPKLDIPRLGSLNLFVGKNNTGKSCLLEAIELYASSSPWDVLRVATRRDPDNIRRNRMGRYDIHEMDVSFNQLINLFHREHGKLLKPTIQLSADNPKSDLKLHCEQFIDNFLNLEMNISEINNPESRIQRKRSSLFLEANFEISRGKEKINVNLNENSFRRQLLLEDSLKKEEWLHPDVAPVAFLPARGFNNNETKRLWDKASLIDQDELLYDLLKFIEPEIRDLRYISDSENSIDLPYLKINDYKGRISLSSMGDGLTRLFHIGLAMANASRGILLIDEFENGLHWEVQLQLWKALFKTAEKFGVQVFVTTHSNDCIQSFIQSQNDKLIPDQSYVYRLERNGDDINAHEFTAQGLEAAIRQGIEVR